MNNVRQPGGSIKAHAVNGMSTMFHGLSNCLIASSTATRSDPNTKQ